MDIFEGFNALPLEGVTPSPSTVNWNLDYQSIHVYEPGRPAGSEIRRGRDEDGVDEN